MAIEFNHTRNTIRSQVFSVMVMLTLHIEQLQNIVNLPDKNSHLKSQGYLIKIMEFHLIQIKIYGREIKFVLQNIAKLVLTQERGKISSLVRFAGHSNGLFLPDFL